LRVQIYIISISKVYSFHFLKRLLMYGHE